MIWVYSGDRLSNGAKELSNLPGFKRLREHHFLKVKSTDHVINWGHSKQLPFDTHGCHVMNQSISILAAANKLTAFELMSKADVRCVPWCKPEDELRLNLWGAEEHTVIIARTKLTGHSGDGIIIVEKGDDLPEAPLYTKYIFKIKEFRVHVVNGQVIDTQQKIRDPEKTPNTWKVRSHENGFIFARNNILNDKIRDSLAIGACSSLGLDFGAVDIVEDKQGRFFVLEVNTAPGLEGQTIKSYGDAFNGACQTQI